MTGINPKNIVDLITPDGDKFNSMIVKYLDTLNLTLAVEMFIGYGIVTQLMLVINNS